MDLPIRAFWLLNSNISRLLAEKDLRAVAIQDCRHGGENAILLRDHLVVEMGDVGKAEQKSPLEAPRDQEGFDELKTLAAFM